MVHAQDTKVAKETVHEHSASSAAMVLKMKDNQLPTNPRQNSNLYLDLQDTIICYQCGKTSNTSKRLQIHKLHLRHLPKERTS